MVEEWGRGEVGGEVEAGFGWGVGGVGFEVVGLGGGLGEEGGVDGL